MNYLELKGMKFYAFIGHYNEEKQIGNKFNIDLRLLVDTQTAAITDRLKDAVDYTKIYKTIKIE